jgi:hypothetical protein
MSALCQMQSTPCSVSDLFIPMAYRNIIHNQHADLVVLIRLPGQESNVINFVIIIRVSAVDKQTC